ncbi:hypothetical protein [Streptomyces sp. NPDC002533]
MHDPLTVAFEIRRPWPQRSPLPAAGHASVRWRARLHHACNASCAGDPQHRNGAFPWWRISSYSAFWRINGRDYYWPPLVTVWHREPGGRDGLTVCRKRILRGDGTYRLTRTWRWHLHHWRIQVPPLQLLRRRLLTRCAWCQGCSTKGDQVNVSGSFSRTRTPWWKGEQGLFHMDCSSIARAHDTCTCQHPVLDHDTYGLCAQCGLRRSFGMSAEALDRVRILRAVPRGRRTTAKGAR